MTPCEGNHDSSAPIRKTDPAYVAKEAAYTLRRKAPFDRELYGGF